MSADLLRVLIADDHPLFRKGLRALLASVPEMQLVGEATSGNEAVQLATALHPDVILMDLQMPNGDGLMAVRQIMAAIPQSRILVVTMFEDDDSIFAAMRAGARGYVLKDMDDDDITRAILAVGRGEAIFSPAIATRMIAFFSVPPAQTTLPFPELTESERSVLRLMARGLRNEAIAAQLSLSPKTVRNYISNIFGKLQVGDRAQAIVRAHKAGLA
jgi:DNA-binding NarL/FixJ family response regulator